MRAWLPVVVLLGLMSPVFAQTTNTSSIEEPAPPALLLADRVFVEDGNRLIAEGNVEALYEDTRLNADRIIYDQTAGTLLIEGQVRITDPNGNIFLADSAEVDAELKNGLLRGARVVLDEQLQLASLEARRVDGRYTQMSKVAVTSCQVCGRDQVPLWQIRARRVIHDEVEKQIYFDEATFHIHKIPVFYAPRLRIPDPSLKRARGFLTPSIRSSSLLGVGIKLPYFVPLGDHQDLTFTPYLSPNTRTLETRYRRAFRYGDIEINSAISQDDLTSDNWRGYVFGTGLFRLPRDFKLKFDFQKTTDDAYLDTYGYSGSDRLKSSIEVSRTRLDEYFSAGVIRYESLRVSEDDDTQPALIFDVEYEKRLHPKALGGEIRLGFNAHHHYRTSTLDVDGSDDDTLVDGRDTTRISTEMSWHRRWTLAGG
ncbi:MAG: LPS assembly protein LptD, partial [Pseudomonadota bacterium]|nr:LPS assembly protein LptD [Pseudomonadota bacterium]